MSWLDAVQSKLAQARQAVVALFFAHFFALVLFGISCAQWAMFSWLLGSAG